jgi:transposase-like protein
MGKKRRLFTSEFKVEVVVELLREERTLGELAAAYEVNLN